MPTEIRKKDIKVVEALHEVPLETIMQSYIKTLNEHVCRHEFFINPITNKVLFKLHVYDKSK